MKITRMSSRLLELGEVYAMKRFRKFVSRKDFVCLSDRVMLLCPVGGAEPEEMRRAVQDAMQAGPDWHEAPEVRPMRDGGAALTLGGGKLFVIADRAEDVQTLTDRVALMQLAREVWQSGQILAVCTGKTPDVEIDIDEVRTRFTAA